MDPVVDNVPRLGPRWCVVLIPKEIFAKKCLVLRVMKSTKVQTLSAVTLHATTDCTDDASIVGLGPVNWAIV